MKQEIELSILIPILIIFGATGLIGCQSNKAQNSIEQPIKNKTDNHTAKVKIHFEDGSSKTKADQKRTAQALNSQNIIWRSEQNPKIGDLRILSFDAPSDLKSKGHLMIVQNTDGSIFTDASGLLSTEVQVKLVLEYAANRFCKKSKIRYVKPTPKGMVTNPERTFAFDVICR